MQDNDIIDTNSIDIEIICPRCRKKALFHSNSSGTSKSYPNKNGKVTCTNCGFNGNHTFTKENYFYKFEIKNRFLYAQNLEKLISIRDYFKNHGNIKMHQDPNFDFPKVFYSNKLELIKKINLLLDQESVIRPL